jgi:hypothetical protein
MSARASIKEARADYIKKLQDGGENTFVLMNNSRSTLTLPKPSLDTPPKRVVEHGECFKGDEYHIKQLGSLITVQNQVEKNAVVALSEFIEVYDPNTKTISKVRRASPPAPAVENKAPENTTLNIVEKKEVKNDVFVFDEKVENEDVKPNPEEVIKRGPGRPRKNPLA